MSFFRMSDEEVNKAKYAKRAILSEEKNYTKVILSACMAYDCNHAKQQFTPYRMPSSFAEIKCTLCGGVMKEVEVFIHKVPNMDFEVNSQVAIPLSQIGSLGFLEETRRGKVTGHNAKGGTGTGAVLVIWDGVKDH